MGLVKKYVERELVKKKDIIAIDVKREKIKKHERGYKNIANLPLIDSENIYLPPLHIKLGLMKNFVKAMDRNASGFAYLKQKFSSISEAKIKEGIFVGPQIRELQQDGNFQNSLNEVEAAAWNSFRNVCKNFLGSVKVENYRDIVNDLLLSYKPLGCNMSLKIHFLHSHLDFFPDNLGAVSDEHGERFHQAISSMEKRYQVTALTAVQTIPPDLPSNVWASLLSKGKLILHGSSLEVIPDLCAFLSSKRKPQRLLLARCELDVTASSDIWDLASTSAPQAPPALRGRLGDIGAESPSAAAPSGPGAPCHRGLQVPSASRSLGRITVAGVAPDVAALTTFCSRLAEQNRNHTHRVDNIENAIVLRGTATPLQRLTTRTARSMLERPRLAALPITQLLGRWLSTPISISWSSLLRGTNSGHNADVAVRLALHALPHPAHPASARESCIAGGSGNLSLAHRYWSCRRIRPVIVEAFTIIQRPSDLQSWIFGHDLEDNALAIMASAKTRIYKYFLALETISRRLVANGLHSCRPLRRLPLTPPNRRQRLEWCRARSTWMTEWHRVVFSDESRFCLSSDSRRVRVWRRRGERSNPAAIVERPTVRQRGIMVWGAIAYDSRSPLLRIQGTMTAQRYVDDVLRPVTLPYLQWVPNALYQQDNARPHTARISQQALQDVQMLPWPPYSPDLSPIEHVWDIIGRRLHALPQPRSEDELWQMVER
ncbi:hypothetical protein LAZ67_X004023 [Cordylochernes scorpioides]|uniref:Transposable element Tc1 transposase n=1 Tax=Cordylochernes scorpioides TaxID=51811 RepID=A0ABY6LV18_9ARAC|nr:hypothetical protein LAZ67_X004023 [Cordylochernes scorpioides]